MLPTKPPVTFQIHASLARTEQHRATSVGRLEAIIAAVSAKRQSLQSQLPELQSKAETATGEERMQAHNDYLRAKDDMRRCDQVFNGAKQQLIIARNL